MRRGTSIQTKNLLSARERMWAGATKAERKQLTKDVKESGIQDENDHFAGVLKKMESADAVGDTSRVFALMDQITTVNHSSSVSRSPPKDEQGNIYTSVEDQLSDWHSVMTTRFQHVETVIESKRDKSSYLWVCAEDLHADTAKRLALAMALSSHSAPLALGPVISAQVPLCLPDTEHCVFDKELCLDCLKRGKKGKATGPDNICFEALRSCEVSEHETCEILRKIWET